MSAPVCAKRVLLLFLCGLLLCRFLLSFRSGLLRDGHECKSDILSLPTGAPPPEKAVKILTIEEARRKAPGMWFKTEGMEDALLLDLLRGESMKDLDETKKFLLRNHHLEYNRGMFAWEPTTWDRRAADECLERVKRVANVSRSI